MKMEYIAGLYYNIDYIVINLQYITFCVEKTGPQGMLEFYRPHQTLRDRKKTHCVREDVEGRNGWDLPPSGSGAAKLRNPAELDQGGGGVELIHNALVGEGHFICVCVCIWMCMYECAYMTMNSCLREFVYSKRVIIHLWIASHVRRTPDHPLHENQRSVLPAPGLKTVFTLDQTYQTHRPCGFLFALSLPRSLSLSNYIQCPPQISSLLVNMSKTGCKKHSLLLILLCFHSKY